MGRKTDLVLTAGYLGALLTGVLGVLAVAELLNAWVN